MAKSLRILEGRKRKKHIVLKLQENSFRIAKEYKMEFQTRNEIEGQLVTECG